MHTRAVLTRRCPPGPGGEPVADLIAVEEPLEIRVEGETISITMRTPGEDLDLVCGFLRAEGVIDGMDDLRAVAPVGPGTVDVRLAEGVPLLRHRAGGRVDRALFASSACGICGSAALDTLRRRAPPVTPWEPPDDLLLSLPERLRAMQEGFSQTGGLHAAAAFDASGALLMLREDVGRHNAADKVIGALLRADRPAAGMGLLLSSRAGFEIVQKAWIAGFSAIAFLGAPTSLAVETAQEAGLPLIGWLRQDRLVRYVRGQVLLRD